MANQITASIYGSPPYDWNAPMGRLNSFDPAQVRFYQTKAPNNVFSGVTCNAIVSVLPTGLQTSPTLYATDQTVAQLVTASNA